MIFGLPWWGWLLLGALAFSVLYLFYMICKHAVYYPLKLLYTKPFTDADHKLTLSGHWDEFELYYQSNGTWYTNTAKKDWSEASFSEPINTLLTLIYEDYDNFEYTMRKTQSGTTRWVDFKHNYLDIDCKVDLFDDNSLVLFTEEFSTTRRELYTIKNFFNAIQYTRDSIIEKQRKESLEANRLAKKDIVTNKMRTYLHKGE